MNHEIDTSKTDVITLGGNPVCTCGTIIGPGEMVAHLQEKLAESQEEANLLIRHIEAMNKSRLNAGAVNEQGRRLF
jgi:hypothetical protein